jgi:ABC-type nitrate/sulfonate/bicarbonate transport system substrate-binding protein
MSTLTGKQWRHLAASVAIAAATIAVTAACSSGAASSGTSNAHNLGTLSITVNPGNVGNLPEFAAAKLGIFTKYGINISLINSTSNNVTMQLLETGQLDFASTASVATIQAVQASQKAMREIVNFSDPGADEIMCKQNDGIPAGYTQAAYQSLIGKTVAMPSTASPFYYAFLTALKQFNVDPSKVNITFIAGNSPMVAALEASKIDCAGLTVPAPQLLPPGFESIFDSMTPGQFAPAILFSNGVLVVLKSYADAHPNAVTAMQKAITVADNYCGNSKNASTIATAVAQYYAGLTHAQLTSVIQQVSSIFRGVAPVTENEFNGGINLYNEFAPQLKLPPISGAKYSDFVAPQIAFESSSTSS